MAESLIGIDTPYKSCPVCRDPRRAEIENAYLSGDVHFDYGHRRSTVETHIGHLADPEALRLIGAAAALSSVAARLRMLESTTMAILDTAVKEGDSTTALRAVKEARNSVQLMAQLAGHLIDRHETVNERPDIDAEIEQALKDRKELGDQRAEAGPESPEPVSTEEEAETG